MKNYSRSTNLFKLMDWDVHILKYGKKLQRLKRLKGGIRFTMD